MISSANSSLKSTYWQVSSFVLPQAWLSDLYWIQLLVAERTKKKRSIMRTVHFWCPVVADHAITHIHFSHIAVVLWLNCRSGNAHIILVFALPLHAAVLSFYPMDCRRHDTWFGVQPFCHSKQLRFSSDNFRGFFLLKLIVSGCLFLAFCRDPVFHDCSYCWQIFHMQGIREFDWSEVPVKEQVGSVLGQTLSFKTLHFLQFLTLHL